MYILGIQIGNGLGAVVILHTFHSDNFEFESYYEMVTQTLLRLVIHCDGLGVPRVLTT